MSNELWTRTEPKDETTKSVTFKGPEGFTATVPISFDSGGGPSKQLVTLDTAIVVLNNMWGVEG